jgi:hypothetical protein
MSVQIYQTLVAFFRQESRKIFILINFVSPTAAPFYEREEKLSHKYSIHVIAFSFMISPMRVS